MALFAVALFAVGCGGASPPSAPPPTTPQVAGTIVVEGAVEGTVGGLAAPVRITRDRWGVPHIYAERQEDLFYAQGFVQAQDRLFQMDLWRRASQGRLAEVLGANFIARDAMTRRVQYDGDLEVEWASYGPDTRAIVSAFVRGINAWVALARERPPEEFVRAGWRPDFWRPEDLLSRTDAFIASGDALGDVFRARLITAVGAQRAADLLQETAGARFVQPRRQSQPQSQPGGLDLGAVSYSVGNAIRLIGTRPFFIGSNAWAIAPRRASTGAPMLANDPHRALDNPSPFYLVHLHAPGWNVAGATPPWLPGVMLGHNDRIAWGMTAYDADVEDVYVERVNQDNPHQVDDRGRWVNTRVVVGNLLVKGRRSPVETMRESTGHGVTLAVDREKGLAFVLRWSGSEPGGAAGLGALALNRAGSWAEFRAALEHWKMPAEEVVYADTDGNIGSQVAALVPIRGSRSGPPSDPRSDPPSDIGGGAWSGARPVSGWNAAGRYEWSGWRTLDELPHAFNPVAGHVVSANGNVARTARLAEVFGSTRMFNLDAFKALQHDVVAVNATRLVPLLARVRPAREDVERARLRLLGWDRRMTVDSEAAAIYAAWEPRLFRRLAARRIDAALVDEFVTRAAAVLVDALTKPSSSQLRTWFGGDFPQARDRIVQDALTDAVDEVARAEGQTHVGSQWGARHETTFRHVLGVGDAAARFNVGPFATPGYRDTLMSTDAVRFDVMRGPSFSAIYDAHDWDRSIVQNAPGQSGSPGNTHFADLARLWAAGQYFPLSYSDEAVGANAEATLVLTPRR